MKKYYFKEKFIKITDDYPIYDENGDKVFIFDQKFRPIGYRAELKDMDKNKLFSIKRKVVRLFPTYIVEFEDGEEMKVKEGISLVKRKLNASFKGMDFKIKGSIFDYDFTVYLDGEKVAKMDKKLISLTDQYELTVYKDELSLPVIALCICVDNIKDEEENEEDEEED